MLSMDFQGTTLTPPPLVGAFDVYFQIPLNAILCLKPEPAEHESPKRFSIQVLVLHEFIVGPEIRTKGFVVFFIWGSKRALNMSF